MIKFLLNISNYIILNFYFKNNTYFELAFP